MQRFVVAQDRCAMKVTQDACLLGALAPLENARRILDVGTGTGLLALMAAQRAPLAKIIAIEPHLPSAEQAQENVTASPFRDAITIRSTSLQEYTLEGSDRFDHVICNPPFHQTGSRSVDEGKRAAWHAVNLTLDDLVCGTVRLLSENGLATFLCPVNEFPLLRQSATKHGLHLHHHIRVRDRKDRPIRRIISVWSTAPGNAQEREFVVRSAPMTYSTAMLDVIKDFYLLSSVRSND